MVRRQSLIFRSTIYAFHSNQMSGRSKIISRSLLTPTVMMVFTINSVYTLKLPTKNIVFIIIFSSGQQTRLNTAVGGVNHGVMLLIILILGD